MEQSLHIFSVWKKFPNCKCMVQQEPHNPGTLSSNIRIYLPMHTHPHGDTHTHTPWNCSEPVHRYITRTHTHTHTQSQTGWEGGESIMFKLSIYQILSCLNDRPRSGGSPGQETIEPTLTICFTFPQSRAVNTIIGGAIYMGQARREEKHRIRELGTCGNFQLSHYQKCHFCFFY